MFANHQPIVGQWARAEPDNLRDVYRFVLLTIRYPLLWAAQDMRDHDNKALTGPRRAAWEYAGEFKREVYEGAMECWDRGGTPELVSFFATLPGLGLVKAGFVAQLGFGVAGCLDSHNLERFGLNVWSFAHFKKRKTARGRERMVARYLAAVDNCGGTEELWNSWCAYVAARDKKYSNAWHVSELHAWAFRLV